MADAKTAAESLTPLQEELLRRADSIFDGISKTVNQAATFAGEQIPDIAYQYVAWGRGYLTAYVVIGAVILAIGMFLALRIGFFNSRKLKNDYSGDWHGARIVAVVLGSMVTAIGFIVVMHNLKELIMVWAAPKIWLINEIVMLVKRSS